MATEKRSPEFIARSSPLRLEIAEAARIQPDIPPTSELFSKGALVVRHPNLLTQPRGSMGTAKPGNQWSLLGCI